MKFFRGTNIDYGNYCCSKCKQPLTPKGFGRRYHVVGEEEDVDGHRWRGFCDECWDDVKNLSNVVIMLAFPAAPCIEQSK